MPRRENILVGLDIGTTKVCAIVGEVREDGRVDITGIGRHPSRGLRKGVVVNIESTVQSIKKAVEEAEVMAGVQINSVYAGIAGGHIKGFNSRGVIAVKDPREVRQSDVRRVIDAARAVAIPQDRSILHVVPQGFVIDDQDGIKEPVGMSGVRLEAEVHIVTGAVSSVQNILKSCHRAGLQVLDIVLEPLASAEAVLTPDERELGVALIDIGGGTTDLAIFVEGSIRHTAVLPMGGNHVTNDIAVGLRTPSREAEALKKSHGCALASLVGPDETIQAPSVGGRPAREMSRRLLAEIIEPRIEEVLVLVKKEIQRSGFDDMVASGVVVTGGTANLSGIAEAVERFMDLPARQGFPMRLGGLSDVVGNPMFATGVGLLLYGAKEAASKGPSGLSGRSGVGKVAARMKAWFKEFF